MAEDDLKITVSPQQFSIDVMLEKYAKGDETRIDDIYRRVARGVALAEPEARRKQVENEFFENFQRGALGAGRIMSAIFAPSGSITLASVARRPEVLTIAFGRVGIASVALALLRTYDREICAM